MVKKDSLFILVHGFSGYPENLSLLKEYLMGKFDADILLPLLEGHKADLERFSKVKADNWITQIEELVNLNRQKYERIILIGFSMGGLISTVVASKNKIDGLILIASPFVFDLKREVALFLAPVLKFFKKYNEKKLDGNRGNRSIRDKEMRKRFPVYYEKEPLSAIVQFNIVRKLAKKSISKIDIPFAAFFSEKDRVCSMKNCDFLKKKMKKAFFCRVYKNSGHLLPLDYDRELLFSDIALFLERSFYEKK